MEEKGTELTTEVLQKAIHAIKNDIDRDRRAPIPQHWYDEVVRIEGKMFAQAHFIPFKSEWIPFN